jgi:hypothetical protein
LREGFPQDKLRPSWMADFDLDAAGVMKSQGQTVPDLDGPDALVQDPSEGRACLLKDLGRFGWPP